MKGITMRDLTVSSQNVREEFLLHPSSTLNPYDDHYRSTRISPGQGTDLSCKDCVSWAV